MAMQEVSVDEIVTWASCSLVSSPENVVSRDQLFNSFCLWVGNTLDSEVFDMSLGRAMSSSHLDWLGIQKSGRKKRWQGVCYKGVEVILRETQSVKVSVIQNSTQTDQQFAKASDCISTSCTLEETDDIVSIDNLILGQDKSDGRTDSNLDLARMTVDLGPSLQGLDGEEMSDTPISEYVANCEHQQLDYEVNLELKKFTDLDLDAHKSAGSDPDAKEDLNASGGENSKTETKQANAYVKVHPFFRKSSSCTAMDEHDYIVEYHSKNVAFRQMAKEGSNFNYLVFSRHFENVKTMTVKNMPCDFKSLEDFVKAQLPEPQNSSDKRQEIWNKSAHFQTDVEKIIKSFLCGSFLPVLVGNVAGLLCKHSFVGDKFPQFSLSGTNTLKFSCQICQPYSQWLAQKGEKRQCSELKLEGFRQVYEHYITSRHLAAIAWWQLNEIDRMNLTLCETKSIQSQKITEYLQVSEKIGRVNCLHLWDHDIVEEYHNDSKIRRKQPKTLFLERKSWLLCQVGQGHNHCNNYKTWKSLHPEEVKALAKEASETYSSLFIPMNNNIIVNGKSVTIKGGIKNLDPPCLEQASPLGEHPYTCKNCWKQCATLKDLMSKRKHSALVKSKSRIGARGFRLSYASKVETKASFEKVAEDLKEIRKENFRLKKTILDRRSWVDMLLESCENSDDEKLVVDLLALFSQPSSLQMEVLKNLVGKMTSGVNHRFSMIIKDISKLHMNRLGRTNYSLLQNLFGLCGKTTAVAHSKVENLLIGLNQQVFTSAAALYDGYPVIDCTDEARTLRFISPYLSCGKLELIGQCWEPDIEKWSGCHHSIPRASENVSFVDDFSALKAYVDKVISENRLAKSTAVHNFSALTGLMDKPMIYLLWPTPNKGYKSYHLLKIWDQVRYNSFMDSHECLLQNPIMLLGHSSDSAAFQLAAAVSLMTPHEAMFSKGIKYLTLGIGESLFASPYLGPLPCTAYLDYDHEMRLFLKCMKYSTLDLILWKGNSSVFVTIDHLKELKYICIQAGNDVPFSHSDLMFARYLDQNCDAALKVFNHEVADLLGKHVPASEGTVLYIRAVTELMSPFLNPSSSPNDMQISLSTGITILRLWRKVLQLKKLRVNAIAGAVKYPENRGHYLTYGCAKTAEILFVAGTNHMLAMFSHFYRLGPELCPPHKTGTKTTERIISELQGKTNQMQCLDAQPTLLDIMNRSSKVQFNQTSEERLLQKPGAKKQSTTNRRRLAHKLKSVHETGYCYPNTFNDFRDQQRGSHRHGVKKGKEMFEKCCPDAAKFLQSKKEWDFLENETCVVPADNQFDGSVSEQYALNVLKNVKSSEVLKNVSAEKEDKIALMLDFKSDFVEESVTDETKTDDDLSDDEDEGGLTRNQRVWYVTKMVGGKLTDMHIHRALKLLIPREFVSRERSRRHIAANYLPGLEPIDASHDIIKFRFVILNLSQGINVGKVISLERNGQPITSVSSSNSEGILMKLLLLNKCGEYCYKMPDPLVVTKWLSITNVLAPIQLIFDGEYFNVERIADKNYLIQATKQREESKSVKLAKQIMKTDVPCEYLEVDRILDRKVDPKTHAYLYLVRFKECDESEDIWLPAQNFGTILSVLIGETGAVIKKRGNLL